jgi:hypothetical protein
VIRSRAASAFAVCLLAVLPTAGCYQGFDNTVNTQGPTGNGTDFIVGEVKVQDATFVADPTGSTGRASLIMTLVNEGELPEALLEVSTEPASTNSLKETVPIGVGQKVMIGGESAEQITITGLDVEAGSYATLTVKFERSGSDSRRVAVVPAVGYYEGYGPAAAE